MKTLSDRTNGQVRVNRFGSTGSVPGFLDKLFSDDIADEVDTHAELRAGTDQRRQRIASNLAEFGRPQAKRQRPEWEQMREADRYTERPFQMDYSDEGDRDMFNPMRNINPQDTHLGGVRRITSMDATHMGGRMLPEFNNYFFVTRGDANMLLEQAKMGMVDLYVPGLEDVRDEFSEGDDKCAWRIAASERKKAIGGGWQERKQAQMSREKRTVAARAGAMMNKDYGIGRIGTERTAAGRIGMHDLNAAKMHDERRMEIAQARMERKAQLQSAEGREITDSRSRWLDDIELRATTMQDRAHKSTWLDSLFQ